MNALAEELVADGPVVRSRRSPRYWVALVALGLMLFMVTKGPVFWIRLEAADIKVGLNEDVWVQTAFVLASALVLACAAPAARALWADRLVTIAFAVFLLTVLASSLWSVTSSRTVQQSTMFLLGSAAALTAGAYLRRSDVLVALWLAMQVGVGVSILAWMRDWPGVVSSPGRLTGIYFNKNSLGPVAIMACASSMALVLVLWRRRAVLLVPLVAACAVVDGYVWWKTYSLSPAMSAVVAFLVVVVIAFLVPGRHVRTRRIVGTLVAAAAVLLTAFVVTSRGQINDRLGRTSTLRGRTGIWEVVLDYSAERPIRGWGFMALWVKPEIIASLEANGNRPVFEAHSGFLEVLLGVGLIGLALLVFVIIVVVARALAALWRSPSVLSAWSLGLVVFALVASLTESFIGPNVLPWVLLCVAVGQAVAVLQRSSVGATDVADQDIDDEHIADQDIDDEHIADQDIDDEHVADDGGPEGDWDGDAADDLTPLHVAAPGDRSVDDTFDFSFDLPGSSPAEELREPRFGPLLDDRGDDFGAVR